MGFCLCPRKSHVQHHLPLLFLVLIQRSPMFYHLPHIEPTIYEIGKGQENQKTSLDILISID
jgi:hypothetical protein